VSSSAQPIKRAAAPAVRIPAPNASLAAIAALIALVGLAAPGCAPREASPEQEVAAVVAVGPRPPGDLSLVSWLPAEDVPLEPRATFVLTFDRALAPDWARAGGVRMEYVGTPATFLTDPFRATSLELSVDGRSVLLDPPDLVPGSTVRLVVTDRLRDAWGGALPAPVTAPVTAPATVRGDERVALTYHVLELPPPR
jgi:hypothetical protein